MSLPVCHLPARRRPRGFSLIELLLAMTVLTAALLAHVAGALSERRLSDEQQTESEALGLVRQFFERLRADPDWSTVYDRLEALQQQAGLPGAPEPHLADGRGAYPPQTYYTDFQASQRLTSFAVLVDVPPLAPPDGDPYGPLALREDTVDAQFAMPADLNGDGAIDNGSRDADYAVLPVVVRFWWRARDGSSRELPVSTWLRGDR